MKAYKIWHDTKHFIHKDTTDSNNIKWTEDINEAKNISHRGIAINFFFYALGFNICAKYDTLHLQ